MGVKPANFERVIKKSGLSKKEIAARKKVKPETLSRHLSGSIRMTSMMHMNMPTFLGVRRMKCSSRWRRHLSSSTITSKSRQSVRWSSKLASSVY